MSFNKIILIGNLGKDPELRYTPQGKAVCSFTMATNEKRRDKSGELQDVTTWFKITLWGQQAENASKYLSKGRPVYIEGRLRLEEWTDRDNNTRYTMDVQATDMQFIGSGREEGGGGYSGGGGGGGVGQSDDDESHSGPPRSSNSYTAEPKAPAPVRPPAGSDDDIPF